MGTPACPPFAGGELLRRPALWVVVGLLLLIGVGLIGWAVSGRGGREGTAGTGTAGRESGGAPAEPSGSVPVSLAINLYERKIVGTWAEAHLDPANKARIEVTTTYRAAGTYQADGTLATLRDGTFTLSLSGTWRVQDSLLIMKIEKEKWGHRESPEFRLSDFFPDRKALEGQATSEQIVSVSDTHLVTKDLETGRVSTAERKR
jgi:hypothetical protein